jgi:hypothetical protein
MTYRGDSKGGASVSLYPVTYISHLLHYVQLQHCTAVRTTTLIAVLQYSTTVQHRWEHLCDGAVATAVAVAMAILRSV